MTSAFLCDQAIHFDAINAYEAKDMEGLINQIQTTLAETESIKVVVLLRNAHYLTTKANAFLYNYI
jgi:RNA-binding protein YhbY